MLLNSISNYGKTHITDKDGICVFNKFIRLLCCEKKGTNIPQKIIRLNIKLSSKIIIAHKHLFYNSILNKTKNMLQI